MARFEVALEQWNVAAKPVVADMDDPTLDVPGFGDRTASDRAKMRSSIDAMEAAIAPGTNADFSAAVRDVIGTYIDRIDAIDGFVVAVADSDPEGMDAAIIKWEATSAGRDQALARFVEAARPYLTPAEIQVWERLLPAS